VDEHTSVLRAIRTKRDLLSTHEVVSVCTAARQHGSTAARQHGSAARAAFNPLWLVSPHSDRLTLDDGNQIQPVKLNQTRGEL
jgi:hypothetical protein